MTRSPPAEATGNANRKVAASAIRAEPEAVALAALLIIVFLLRIVECAEAHPDVRSPLRPAHDLAMIFCRFLADYAVEPGETTWKLNGERSFASNNGLFGPGS
jgi:hypothetical protein